MEVVTAADHHLPDAVDAMGTAALPTSGLAVLSLIARLHHISTDANTLGHQLNIPPSRDITAQELLLTAKHIGLKAKLTSCTADRLHLQPLPALALMRDEQGDKKMNAKATCATC